MPQTAKAIAARERFQQTMAHAQAVRAEAQRQATLSSSEKVSERYAKIAALMSKAETITMNARADAFVHPPSDMTREQMIEARNAWHKRHNLQKQAEKTAKEHAARVTRVADMIAGTGPNARMAAVRKGFAASKAENSKRAKAQKLKSQSQRRGKPQRTRASEFGVPTPYQRKTMWTDKNGKVYHRRITLPTPSAQIKKYRKPKA